MKKTILIILSGLMAVTAQAAIYCPQGPVVCSKNNPDKVPCTLSGAGSEWKFRYGFPIVYPEGTTIVHLPFTLALSDVAGQNGSCGYLLTLKNGQVDEATFVASKPIVARMTDASLNMWSHSPVGHGFACGPTQSVNACPFQAK